MLSVEEQLTLIKENTAEIIAEEELVNKLQRSFAEKRPLRCKLGIDPSAPDIHPVSYTHLDVYKRQM